ncbi:MAG: DNA double-strand break repair nuclease NurA [Anaerolineales bacterium]
MTIDYRQLYPKIRLFADQVEQSTLGRHQRCESALQVLAQYASEVEFLQERVDQVLVQEGKTLRCAKPFETTLDASYPLPKPQRPMNLAAADGSQILPDRHAELYFGMINLGGVTLPQGSALFPMEVSQSEFWYGESEDFNESLFNFRRDVLERKLLLEISLTLEPPVLALTDGPLELWMEYRTSDEGRQELRSLLQSYFDALERFRAQGILLCGYVDRPQSAYVIRLLELAIAERQDLAESRRFRPFKGVFDADLFVRLLRPGERSAIFRLQSPLQEQLPAESEICFFYLRTGSEVEANIVRVEIPLWLARDRVLVDQLQYTLIAQCRQSGAYPYPYLLHRAHEVAVVHPEDREVIVRSLLTELHRRGYPPPQLSHKQALKNLPVRQKSHLD